MDFHAIVLVNEDTVNQRHGNAAFQLRDVLMLSELCHPFAVLAAVFFDLNKTFLQSVHLLFAFGGTFGIALLESRVFLPVDD